MILREFFILNEFLNVWLGRDAIWIDPSHPKWGQIIPNEPDFKGGINFVEINNDGLVYPDIMTNEAQDDGQRFGVRRVCLLASLVDTTVEAYHGGLDRIQRPGGSSAHGSGENSSHG